MVSVEEAIKHINNKANEKHTITGWVSRHNEVEYNFRTYYKTFKYLSDRSKIYTYIEKYLKDNNIPHSFEIQYEQCYVKKDGKQVREKKLLFTINIA
jgi:hypothetical protein